MKKKTVIQFRVRLRAGKRMPGLFDPARAPARAPSDRRIREGASVLTLENIVGAPWLLIPDRSAGLPVADWKIAWDNDQIEFDRVEKKTWVEIKEWRELGL
ncbi:MAG: hypothetical protein KGI78_01060 [Patescibacteria group bacterium]|nr:hypothetical protein [Patescibacteria group bacterium]MDE2057425.1 hypothetical protein [Patescibacteria group bacterium]